MPDLVVQDLSMRFGGVTALDGLSFSVESAQICSLIGPNGAGKTSLFNCVSRIYQPTSGAIRFGDVDLLRLPAHKIARFGVARTFQNLGLFPSLTFLENVMAGAHARGRTGFGRAITHLGVRNEEATLCQECYDLLDLLGLADLAFMNAANQPFGTLKRLEIARALAARPQLLLMDEPAGGLTHSEVDELADLILRVRDEFSLTVLLVEHHMPMVMAVSDNIVAMASGQKIAEGSPEFIRTHPDVVAAYLGTPA